MVAIFYSHHLNNYPSLQLVMTTSLCPSSGVGWLRNPMKPVLSWLINHSKYGCIKHKPKLMELNHRKSFNISTQSTLVKLELCEPQLNAKELGHRQRPCNRNRLIEATYHKEAYKYKVFVREYAYKIWPEICY